MKGRPAHRKSLARGLRVGFVFRAMRRNPVRSCALVLISRLAQIFLSERHNETFLLITTLSPNYYHQFLSFSSLYALVSINISFYMYFDLHLAVFLKICRASANLVIKKICELVRTQIKKTTIWVLGELSHPGNVFLRGLHFYKHTSPRYWWTMLTCLSIEECRDWINYWTMVLVRIVIEGISQVS